MKSWKSAVTSVVPATARSTCSSPSTSRRTAMPSMRRCSSLRDESVLTMHSSWCAGSCQVAGDRDGDERGLLDVGQMCGVGDHDQLGLGDARLEQITSPTLVIAGEQDPATPV